MSASQNKTGSALARKKLRLPADVIWQENLTGKCGVLKLSTAHLYEFNGQSADVYGRIVKSESLQSCLDWVEKTYPESQSKIKGEVVRLAEFLVEEGLLEPC